jgi:uncharacterized membrane protein YeiB
VRVAGLVVAVLALIALAAIRFRTVRILLTAGAVLGGALIALLIYWAVQQQKDESREIEQMRQEREASDAAFEAAESAEATKAIELAKASHALRYVDYDLPAGAIPLGGNGSGFSTNTDRAIKNEMSRLKGDVTVFGWRAERIDGQTYVVTYTYLMPSSRETRGWAFEVKVPQEIVRNVLEDPELRKKYGWGVARGARVP